MINKEEKRKILNLYTNKEEKIFAASIMDLAFKFYNAEFLMHTEFLNLNELSIAKAIFNKCGFNYSVFKSAKDAEKAVIFLIPSYLSEDALEEIFKESIIALKIIPSGKNSLKHRDYMGAIYSLGINDNRFGDIFVIEGVAYIFVLSDIASYIVTNLSRVGTAKIKIERVGLYSDEIKNLHFDYKEEKIRVNSNRADAILASAYNISRNEVKSKIEAGDLFINSKQIFFVANQASENDIFSLKKFGKFKIVRIIISAKTGKNILVINKYI